MILTTINQAYKRAINEKLNPALFNAQSVEQLKHYRRVIKDALVLPEPKAYAKVPDLQDAVSGFLNFHGQQPKDDLELWHQTLVEALDFMDEISTR